MTDLTQKHDKLARKLLTDLEVAKEFLQLYLPTDIKQLCDFNSLSIENCSFVNEDLKSTQADVVYKIDLYPNGKSEKPEIAYIYTLVEHQSQPDWLMPLRILQYQINIIRRHIEKYRGNRLQSLPMVIPLVFYNGRRSPYPHPCDIADMFVDRDLYQKNPLGRFSLVDLTVLDDDKILQHKKLPH